MLYLLSSPVSVVSPLDYCRHLLVDVADSNLPYSLLKTAGRDHFKKYIRSSHFSTQNRIQLKPRDFTMTYKALVTQLFRTTLTSPPLLSAYLLPYSHTALHAVHLPSTHAMEHSSLLVYLPGAFFQQIGTQLSLQISAQTSLSQQGLSEPQS